MRKECILTMALLTAVFSFFGLFGCKKSDAFPTDPSAVPVALGVSRSSMSMTDSYVFSLRCSDDKVLFTADWYDYDTESRLEFENREVPYKSMECLLEIITRYNLVEYVGKYRDVKPIFDALDDEKYYLTLHMSDGSYRQISSAGDARVDLYGFFTALAKETAASDAQSDLTGEE